MATTANHPFFVGHSGAAERDEHSGAIRPVVDVLGNWHLRAMREIELDASRWSSGEDFFSELLLKLGAPGWHGHNLDALWDSITSDINEVLPPFRVIVRQASNLSDDIAVLVAGASGVFIDAKNERGVDVAFSIC